MELTAREISLRYVQQHQVTAQKDAREVPLRGGHGIACPRCSSLQTELVSEFGSTACKASYKCSDCLEPFEYFKCI